ncbi:MAG TPA: TonB-dependent receptor, partial [Sphingobacterium sp.]|nr:TonB-dependent receptor [Sphingobacterium sp.]
MRFFFFFSFFVAGSLMGYAQQSIRVSGYIKDASSGELLIGASIQVMGTAVQVSSNTYGYFAINVPDGAKRLAIGYVGYGDLIVDLDSVTNHRLNIELSPLENVLEEVVVSSSKENKNVSSPQMGTIGFTMEEVKNIPVVFGERDILKTIQLLPGVGKGGEGSSNFYVRGGGGDQNLVLLDEATVYNASHLMGFFSTFNSDAIKDLELYKGGIPAQYGGRISSVIDIHMIDGNNKQFSAEGGLGLIASRLKL